MTQDEYRNALMKAWVLSQLLMDIPAGEMLNQISHAEAVGPILDPTLYRDKATALKQDRDMLRAVASAQEGLGKIGLKTITEMAEAHALRDMTAASGEGGAT